MIEFQIFGDWTKVRRGLAKLPRDVKEAAIEGQRQVAERLVKVVKGHINKQDLGWAPRSENSIAGDPRILVNTEAYLNSIKAFRKGGMYFAGVPRSAKDSEGRSIAEYAVYHEEGTRNMPARKLWEPSIKEAANPAKVKQIVTRAIFNKVKQLRALGFEVNYT